MTAKAKIKVKDLQSLKGVQDWIQKQSQRKSNQ